MTRLYFESVASRSSSIGGLMMPSGVVMEEDTLCLPKGVWIEDQETWTITDQEIRTITQIQETITEI
ncbi:hypothetical protein GCM10010498_58520 [Streptomyces cavourensis]|nr:hypothetical protein GCM10010498_58520 [Streptomyces cavourensis]